MAKIYSLPRALIVGSPKVKLLDERPEPEKEAPEAAKPRGRKTELIGRSAKSRHSCSQLLAAITAPFDVGHYSLTYGDWYPQGKKEISLEKESIQTAAKRAGLFGIWVLEFQRPPRQAAHWHMLLWERQPGAREKFAEWWHRHTENDDKHAIIVRQGEEGKASWYFNYHQEKTNQTPPVKVGRWWGKVDKHELEKWIHCEYCADTQDDREIIWLKRVARRMHRASYRASVARYLRTRSGVDPRMVVKTTRRKGSLGEPGTVDDRRRVMRMRTVRSSMGAQGFTWFLREEDHARVLSYVAQLLRIKYPDPF